MTVGELIKILSSCNPATEVSIWDAYHDTITMDVEVSMLDDTVHISTLVWTPLGKTE